MKGLQGRTAIVTGGSSGIGQAIAIRLAAEGVNVAINYTGRPDGALATVEQIEAGLDQCMSTMRAGGGRPMVVQADVSDASDVERMFKEVVANFGSVVAPNIIRIDQSGD